MKSRENLLLAAVTGTLLGVAGCGGSQASAESPSTEPTAAAATDDEPEMSDMGMMDEESDGMAEGKHACKGQNDCKGQGGCKTDTNACKGQNECKGQGGCETT